MTAIYLQELTLDKVIRLKFFRVEDFPGASNAYLAVEFYFGGTFCTGMIFDPSKGFEVVWYHWPNSNAKDSTGAD